MVQPGVGASARAAPPPRDRPGVGHWLCSFPRAEASGGPPAVGDFHQKRRGLPPWGACVPPAWHLPLGGGPPGPQEPSGPVALVGSPPRPAAPAAPASGHAACPQQCVTCPLGGTSGSSPVLRGTETSDSSQQPELTLAPQKGSLGFPSCPVVEAPADPADKARSPMPAGRQTWAGGSVSPPLAQQIRSDHPRHVTVSGLEPFDRSGSEMRWWG